MYVCMYVNHMLIKKYDVTCKNVNACMHACMYVSTHLKHRPQLMVGQFAAHVCMMYACMHVCR